MDLNEIIQEPELNKIDENLVYIYDKYLKEFNDEDKIEIIDEIINNIFDIEYLIKIIKKYQIYQKFIRDLIIILNEIFLLKDDEIYKNIYKYNIKEQLLYLYELMSIIDIKEEDMELNKNIIIEKYNYDIYDNILKYIKYNNYNEQKIIYIINKL